MANANIPKAMNIVPQVLGVSQFVANTNRVQTSVRNMVNGVNRSLGNLRSTSQTLSGTSSTIQRVSGALGSSLQSINRWASGFDATDNVVTRFGRNLESIGSKINRLTFQMERMGRSMTLFFTLPIIGAGTAMVKAGKDFETALLKTENLVGINARTMKAWEEQILSTANRLGILPVEMAEGLFFAASGFGELAAIGTKTMDVLINSSKAAAIGLGETGDIARATNALINAFGETALDAEAAVSLLVVGVQRGSFEVEKLATAIGNVLGTATAIGASASDVLAFVSAYTRLGVEPARAVTALNTAITNLIKPSKQANEILEAYGLNADTIRNIIAGPEGLAGLLIRMRDSIDPEQFVRLFGQRALRGVLALTDAGSDLRNVYLRAARDMDAEVNRTFSRMRENVEVGSRDWKLFTKEAIIDGEKMTSAIDDAFAKLFDTLDFKIGRIKSLIQTIFINANSAISEPLKDIADNIIELLLRIDDFARRNQETVALIIKLALALAAIGPSLIVVAKLAQSFGVLASVSGILIGTIGNLVGHVINLAVHMGVLAINVGVTVVQSFLALSGLAINLALSFGSIIATGIVSFVTALGATVGATAASFIGLVAAIGPLVLAIAAIGAAALAAIGALSALGDFIGRVISTVTSFFTGAISKGREWGGNLMREFNKGILDGLIELVSILNQIGQVLAHWLAPGSPPRIAPEIDDWGTKTMQEWINGWLKADFSIFNQIQDTIESFLQSVFAAAGQEDEDGIIPKILLGSREAIAEAINQVRLMGSVTQEALNNIFSAIGTTTGELEEYISALLNAAAATKALEDAQEKVNQVHERYANILSPIQEHLARIEQQRQGISEDREVQRLQRLLERGNLPEQIRKLAQLRITEIGLQSQQADIETERDRALAIAEEQLAEAQRASEAAQRRLEFAEGALGLQTRSLDLMTEMKKAVDEIKDTAKKIKEKLDEIGDSVSGGELVPLDLSGLDVGNLGEIFTGDNAITNAIGETDEKLRLLKENLTDLGETWGMVWTNAKARISEWATGVRTSWNTVKTKFFDVFGEVLETLEEEGVRTFDNISEVVLDFWDNVKDDEGLQRVKDIVTELSSDVWNSAPDAIRDFSDAINDELIPSLDTLLQWFADDPIGRIIIPAISGGGLAIPTLLSPVISAFDDLVQNIVEQFEGENTPLQNIDISPAFTKAVDNAIAFLKEDIPEKLNTLAEEIGFTEGDWDEILSPQLGKFNTSWENAEQDILTKFDDFVTDSTDKLAGVGDSFDGIGESVANFIDSFDFSDPRKELKNTNTSVGTLSTGFTLNKTKAELLRLKILELKDKLIELKDQAIETTRQKLEEFRQKVIEWISTGEDWRLKLEALVTWVNNLATAIVEQLISALNDLKAKIEEELNASLETLLQWFKDIVAYLNDKFKSVIDDIKTKLDELKTFISNLFEPLQKLLDLLREIWDWWQKLTNAGVPISNNNTDNTSGTTPVPPDLDQLGFSAGGASSSIISNLLGAISRTIGQTASFSSGTVGTGTVSGPRIIANPGSAVAMNGGVAIQIGNVIINNDMDMVTFEERVRNVVTQSITG